MASTYLRGGDPRAFGAMLQTLREDGCTILVTGDIEIGGTTDVTPAFFGSPARERHRVLTLAGHPPTYGTVNRLLPDGVSPFDESVTVVEHQPGVRSASIVPPSSAGYRPDSRVPTGNGNDPDGTLDGLTTVLSGALADVQARPGRLEPATLRLCVIYLRELLDVYRVRAVARFCRIIGSQVRGLSGMAYFHLGTPSSSEWVAELDPIFDARIDLGRRDGGPIQRWHVHEYGYETGWFPLEPPE